VVDGDTIRLSAGEKVRLIGVDTPETKHPTKPVQYFGKEASQFTQREIEHRSVVLDFEANKRDKYGRLLAYVYRSPDRFFLNAEIVKQGYGFVYTRFPFKYMEAFRRYEKQARAEGRGLWQREKKERAPSPVPPTLPVEESLSPTIEERVVENKAVEEIHPAQPDPAPTPQARTPEVGVADSEPVVVKKPVAPGNCKIKGNISRKGEKIYHMPGGRWYEKTVIVEGEGERWFCTEEEAEQAGWRKAGG
jgi:micrococcal nuclease